MGVTLVADGGATSLRMGIVDPGADGPGPDGQAALSTLVEVPGFQWTRDADPVDQQCDRLVAAWEELGRPAPVDKLAFGLAGGAPDVPSRQRLVALVSERTGAREVLATGDDVTTHLGVLGGAPGIVIAAGTGTLCLAVTPAGGLVKVDGLGYLFGDLGSGYSLGLAGIRAALAAVELRGRATTLRQRLGAWVGEPVRDEVKKLYGSQTVIAQVASFAAEVAAAAETDGDEVATGLCQVAGAELAADVMSAVRQAFPDAGPGSVPVSWSGSVLRSASTVFNAFMGSLATRCPQVVPHEPRGNALAGAVRLASGVQVPHLADVVRNVAAS